MTKEERIASMENLPDDALFFVKRGGEFWKQNDFGYTDDFTQAKSFSHAQILEMLNKNELIGKTVLMMKLHYIC